MEGRPILKNRSSTFALTMLRKFCPNLHRTKPIIGYSVVIASVGMFPGPKNMDQHGVDHESIFSHFNNYLTTIVRFVRDAQTAPDKDLQTPPKTLTKHF